MEILPFNSKPELNFANDNKNGTKSVGLRVKPTKSSKAIRTLQAGDQLEVIAKGKTWLKVRDNKTGKTGYVAAEYVTRK